MRRNRDAFTSLATQTLNLKGIAMAASLSLAGCMGGGDSSGGGSGDTLAFRTSHVDRPRSTEIRILDPNGATQVRINVVIENASGHADEVRADHLVNNSDAIRNLEADRRVYAYTLEIAYLDGQISWSKRQAMLAQWAPESTQSHDILSERIKETQQVLEAYRNGQVGEQRLAETGDNAVSYLPSHGDYGARKLDELARDDRIDVTVPDTSFGVLTYRASVEKVARRVGNRAYGQLEQSVDHYSIFRVPEGQTLNLGNADHLRSEPDTRFLLTQLTPGEYDYGLQFCNSSGEQCRDNTLIPLNTDRTQPPNRCL